MNVYFEVYLELKLKTKWGPYLTTSNRNLVQSMANALDQTISVLGEEGRYLANVMTVIEDDEGDCICNTPGDIWKHRDFLTMSDEELIDL